MNELNGEPAKAPDDDNKNSGEPPAVCDSAGLPLRPKDNLSASGAVTVADSQKSCASFNKQSPSIEYVYGIRTSEGGKITDHHWNKINLKVGDCCVAENENGEFLGSVEFTRHPIVASGCKGKRIGKVIRLATESDLEKGKSLAKKEKTARIFCRDKIEDHELPMSLTRVNYSFDGRKAIFFFTADSRVDFRELVKDLVSYTRVKVEMRQIGVRDEARMLGGCGPCGGELCCASFIRDFHPVSIKMAKNQNLSLNPAKISGVCGRLMCCLSFENAHYVELQKHSPKMGKSVTTPDGSVGKVCHLNLIKEKATVIFDDQSKQEFHTGELTRNIGGHPAKVEPKPAKPKEARRPERSAKPESSRSRPPAKKEERQDNRRFQTSGERKPEPYATQGEETKKKRRRRKRKRMGSSPEDNKQASDKASPPQRPDLKKAEGGSASNESARSLRRRAERSRDRSGKRRRDAGQGDKK